MRGLWFSLLFFLVSLCSSAPLKTRRGCAFQHPSGRIPAAYDDGPLAVSQDYVYIARGGYPCKTNSDLWRFKRSTLEFIDSLPNTGECIKLASAAVTKDSLYVGANDGFVYRVDTNRWIVTDRLDLSISSVATGIIDETRNLAFFADNNPTGNSTIVKVNLTDFTVLDRVHVPDEHVGQIAPAFHPNGNEILFFALNGIVRVDIEEFTVQTEEIRHGFVFARGLGNVAVVSVEHLRLSLYDLSTFSLIPSDLDDVTNEIGTPWIVEWFDDTNTMLVIYDLGGFSTYEYRFQYYDMSDFSIIDDGTIRGPSQGLLRKTDTGLYDRFNLTVYLRFFESDSFIALEFDRCHPDEFVGQEPRVLPPDEKKPDNLVPGELTETEKEYFLAVIIVGSIVAILLLVAIGIGVLLVVQRLPYRRSFLSSGYEKE